MTAKRKIEMIIEGSPPFQVIDMMVKNYLPILSNYQRMSPFFMMDHEAPEKFDDITGQEKRWAASASRVGNRHHRL